MLSRISSCQTENVQIFYLTRALSTEAVELNLRSGFTTERGKDY